MQLEEHLYMSDQQLMFDGNSPAPEIFLDEYVDWKFLDLNIGDHSEIIRFNDICYGLDSGNATCQCDIPPICICADISKHLYQ